MKYLRLCIFFYICSIVSALAATYYVDATKSNTNDGLSEATAWKNVSKVESFSISPGFSPGDKILLKRGQLHTGSMALSLYGTYGNPITIGAYPVPSIPPVPLDPIPRLATIGTIPGANNSANWSNQGSNVWRLANVAINPTRVRLSGVEYVAAESVANIDDHYRWYYDDINDSLYLYCTANPTTIHTAVAGGIAGLGGAKYILWLSEGFYNIVENIEIIGGYESGIYIEDNQHTTIRNSVIRNGRAGIVANGGIDDPWGEVSYLTIEHNDIDSRADYSYNYEFKGIRDGIFLSDGVTRSLVYDNDISNWGRAGIKLVADYSSAKGLMWNTIRKNTISAARVSYCAGIVVESDDPNAILTLDLKILNNTIENTSAPSRIAASKVFFYGNSINNVSNSPAYSSASRGTGIGLEVYNSNSFPYCYNNVIMNNTISNCDDVGLRFYSESTTFGLVKGNAILSNSITNCGNSQGSSYFGIALEVSESTLGYMKNNKFFNNTLSDSVGDNDVFYKGDEYTASVFNTKAKAGDKIYGNN
jgi:Right handed beta helix region